MIEGERRLVGDGEPGGVAGVGGGAHAVIGELDQRVVGHRDDPLARIAIGLAEGVELLEEDLGGEAGLLFQLAARRFFDALGDADEAAWQRPAALERRQIALHQQDLEAGVVEAEDDAVDGEGRAGKFVGRAHGSSGEGSRSSGSAHICCSSSANPEERMGKRHQVLGSRFSSSRWKLGRVAFALPLVAATEAEEALESRSRAAGRVRGEADPHRLEDLGGEQLVADGRALDGVEEMVGHQIGLVGLAGLQRAQLGGRAAGR